MLDGGSLLGIEVLLGVEHAFEQDRVAVRRGQGPGQGPRRRVGDADTAGTIHHVPKHQRLREGDVPATETEIREAALEFVRKVSGYGAPSKPNEEAFDGAVDEVARPSGARSSRHASGLA